MLPVNLTDSFFLLICCQADLEERLTGRSGDSMASASGRVFQFFSFLSGASAAVRTLERVLLWIKNYCRLETH